DKGTGLLALLDWAGLENAMTFAVGDSGSDLAMFRVATRCFAPAQVSCRDEIKELKCQISDRAYQNGLLDIVHSLILPDGKRCRECDSCERLWVNGRHPLADFFKIADGHRLPLRFRALIDFLTFHLLQHG